MPTSIPINNFLGTFTSPAVAIPDGAVRGEITVSGAAIADPNLRMSIALDFSPDGGATWSSTSPGRNMDPFPTIATFSGGSIDKHGNPITLFDVSNAFPPGTNRMIRGTFIVDGVALTGTGAINVA